MSDIPPNERIYAAVDCARPGVIRGYAEAKRRTSGRGYMKRCQSVADACRYYETTTGHPPPSVQVDGAHAHAGHPAPDRLPRLVVETESGRIDKVVTDPDQVDGLRALGLWP